MRAVARAAELTTAGEDLLAGARVPVTCSPCIGDRHHRLLPRRGAVCELRNAYPTEEMAKLGTTSMPLVSATRDSARFALGLAKAPMPVPGRAARIRVPRRLPFSAEGNPRPHRDIAGNAVLLCAIPPNLGPAVIDDSELGDGAGYAVTDRRTLRSRKADCIDLLGDNTNVATSKAGSVGHFEAETVVENLLREIAGKAPLAIGEGDPLKKAVELINRSKVKRLIVTDDAGRLCGIVSRADLIKLFAMK